MKKGLHFYTIFKTGLVALANKKTFLSLLGTVLLGLHLNAQTTVTFNYTGAAQTWTVPACVFSIQVDVRGAKGANSNFGVGGNGARVTATMAVTPGQVLQINVGGAGALPAAGWNGGGAGRNGFAPGGHSGGGGGASDIRVAPYALANRVVVAGGGGGAAGGTNPGSGGGGGCANGVAGTGSPYTVTGGVGGSQVAGGNGGPPWFPGVPAAVYGGNGALAVGGIGGLWGDASGGGGGGGYYGGGGGGSDGCCTGGNGGGGGGGGSSLTPGGGVCTQSFNNGVGIVTITYTGGGAIAVPTNTGPYCEGATINLNVPAGVGVTSYDWAGPNGYSALGVQNPTIPGATLAMGGVYTVTVTSPTCTSTGTTTVVVNPNPTPVATNTGPYCTGNTIQLNSVGGLPTDDWAGPGGYSAIDVTNPTIAAATPAMTGDYTVTVTNGFSCTATSVTTVTVNPLPTPTAANTGPYCEGEVVDVTSSGGVDYDWTGPGGFVLNNTQNVTIPSAQMPMNGTYTVTVTDANNCSATATTTMVVNLMPIPVAGNDGPYCEGDPINFTSGGGDIYGWSGPGGYVSALQNPSINPSVVANSGTYTVLVTTLQGCSQTITTDVVVTALPIPVASNTGPYCEGDRIELFVVDGTSWAWSGPQSYASTTQNPTIVNAQPNFSGVYTVVATDGAGCTASATTDVLVSPTPTAVPQFSPQNPSMLDPEVDFSESSFANIVSYVWFVDGVNYSTSTFTHTFPDPGDYTSYLVVTNIYGCFDTTHFNVHVDPQTSIYIPNTFTPNGDGLNETFTVYGLGWESMEMIIFDRWGSEVFYSTDPAKAWNGSRQNAGELLMEGTYTYKIFIRDIYGKDHNFMGHVNLIR